MHSDELDDYKRDVARVYLERVRNSYFKAESMRERIEDLRRNMYQVRGIDYSSMGPRGCADDGSGRLAAGIDAADKMSARFEEMLGEWDALVREAAAAAAMLERSDESALVMDYYIMPCGNWSDVAMRLGCSYSNVMAIRSRALLDYYDLMPERERNLPSAL